MLHRTPGRLFLQKLNIAQTERLNQYQPLPLDLSKYINCSFHNCVINFIRVIIFPISENIPSVPVHRRKAPNFLSIERCNVRAACFRRPEKTPNLGIFPRFRFVIGPASASTDLRPVVERVSKHLPPRLRHKMLHRLYDTLFSWTFRPRHAGQLTQKEVR